MKDTRYGRVTITIPQHLLEWIDAKAEFDERSRSYVMAKMVEKIIAKIEADKAAIPMPSTLKTVAPEANAENKKKA